MKAKFLVNVQLKTLCVILRGSAIAKIVGINTKRHSMFEEIVQMYTYEEMVNGEKLTEIINTKHENVKYLPGYKLPENIVSVSVIYYNFIFEVSNCILLFL